MRRVIRKVIRKSEGGIDLAADVNAVIAVNRGEGQHTEVRSTQRAEQPGTGGPEPDPNHEAGPTKEAR